MDKKIEDIPLNVKMKLAKDEYIKGFNEVTCKYKIPAFLMEIILGQIYTEVKMIAQKDLEEGLNILEKGEENVQNQG